MKASDRALVSSALGVGLLSPVGPTAPATRISRLAAASLAEAGQLEGVGAEGVGFDEVAAGVDVFGVNLLD